MPLLDTSGMGSNITQFWKQKQGNLAQYVLFGAGIIAALWGVSNMHEIRLWLDDALHALVTGGATIGLLALFGIKSSREWITLHAKVLFTHFVDKFMDPVLLATKLKYQIQDAEKLAAIAREKGQALMGGIKNTEQSIATFKEQAEQALGIAAEAHKTLGKKDAKGMKADELIDIRNEQAGDAGVITATIDKLEMILRKQNEAYTILSDARKASESKIRRLKLAQKMLQAISEAIRDMVEGMKAVDQVLSQSELMRAIEETVEGIMKKNSQELGVIQEIIDSTSHTITVSKLERGTMTDAGLQLLAQRVPGLLEQAQEQRLLAEGEEDSVVLPSLTELQGQVKVPALVVPGAPNKYSKWFK